MLCFDTYIKIYRGQSACFKVREIIPPGDRISLQYGGPQNLSDNTEKHGLLNFLFRISRLDIFILKFYVTTSNTPYCSTSVARILMARLPRGVVGWCDGAG